MEESCMMVLMIKESKLKRAFGTPKIESIGDIRSIDGGGKYVYVWNILIGDQDVKIKTTSIEPQNNDNQYKCIVSAKDESTLEKVNEKLSECDEFNFNSLFNYTLKNHTK